MSDVQAKSMTALNIADELGGGSAERAHTRLLADFLTALLSRVKGEPVRFEALDVAPLPSTVRLVTEGRNLFASDREEVACGALLAQEWHAYPQLVRLYEGTRNYMHLFEVEDFHDACEYFYIHIGASEKEHKEQSLAAAARTCATAEQIALLKQGFDSYLDLLDGYWSSLFTAVVQRGADRPRALAQ